MAYTCVKDLHALFPPPVSGSHFHLQVDAKGFQICSTALSGSDLMTGKEENCIMAQQQACPIATAYYHRGARSMSRSANSQHRQLQLSTQLWVFGFFETGFSVSLAVLKLFFFIIF